MHELLEGVEPELLWKHFDEIRKIPRCSGSEEKIRDYIVNFAKQNNLEYDVDKVGNVVVRKNATHNKDNAPTIILQGHMDMVCEKNSDVEHDFTKDPIKLKKEGSWLKADGTTLGADNGIGVAAGLAVLEDNNLVHGPIEVLVTVDEETGLTGASQIEPGFLNGKIMLNLDSEDEGVFFIGCAGGGDSVFKVYFKNIKPTKEKGIEIKISGLKGGHSGLDINKGRGNAIKIMSRLLNKIREEIDFELSEIEGGDKHNAIPRETTAKIITNPENKNKIEDICNQMEKTIKAELKGTDEGIKISVNDIDIPEKVVTKEKRNKIINILLSLPHGVLKMSQSIEGLVETSTNLASIHTKDDFFLISKSSRSSIDSSLDAFLTSMNAYAELIDAEIEQPNPYPGWTPNPDSEILKKMKAIYKNLFNKEAKVEAIHAGLETGIIGEKFPGMDMISFGPEIKNPHSPDEVVEMETVKKFWDLLVKTLEELA